MSQSDTEPAWSQVLVMRKTVALFVSVALALASGVALTKKNCTVGVVCYGTTGADRIYSHGGNDRINTRDGEVDRVDCGAGEDDRLTADHIDIVLGGCETVFLPPPS